MRDVMTAPAVSAIEDTDHRRSVPHDVQASHPPGADRARGQGPGDHQLPGYLQCPRHGTPDRLRVTRGPRDADDRLEDRPSLDASRLIAFLNAINVGELDGIRVKLAQARRGLHLIWSRATWRASSAEAEEALFGADMKTYRKRIETVISRLGHVR